METDSGRWAASLEAGKQASKEGKLIDAEQAYHSALVFAKRLGPRSPEVLESLTQLAFHYRHAGDRRKAIHAGRRLLALQEALLGTSHPDLAPTLDILIDIYGWQSAQVERLSRRKLTLLEDTFGPRHWDVAGALAGLANYLGAHKRCTEAVPYWERALAIVDHRHRQIEPASWRVRWIVAVLGLASCYSQLGMHAEAERLYRRLLRRQVRLRGPDNVSVAWALVSVAQEVRAQGRLALTATLLQRAVTVQEAWWATREDSVQEHARKGISMLRMMTLREHAGVLRELGRTKAAAAVEARIQNHEAGVGVTDSASKSAPLTA